VFTEAVNTWLAYRHPRDGWQAWFFQDFLIFIFIMSPGYDDLLTTSMDTSINQAIFIINCGP
jgi:hypothetical protein